MVGLRDGLNPKCEVLGALCQMPKSGFRPRTSLTRRLAFNYPLATVGGLRGQLIFAASRGMEAIRQICEGNNRR